MLYPESNAFRTVVSLDGFWRFRADAAGGGRNARWFANPWPADAATVAVPGAWNEQLAERGLMNFIGAGWYATDIALPSSLVRGRRIALRIGSAEHRAEGWLNGLSVGRHDGGYLPFAFDLTDAWRDRGANRLVVRVDSTLDMATLPQGIDPRQPPYDGAAYARRHSSPPARFDFFQYGGLTRSVALVVTARTFIDAVRIHAALDGRVTLRVRIAGVARVAGEERRIAVAVRDAHGRPAGTGEAPVAQDGEAAVTLRLDRVHRWTPNYPHLYLAEVRLFGGAEAEPADGHDEPFGVREITVEGGRLLLNGEPLFLTGCGKHEDFPIVGRGAFRAGYLRDLELLRWLGANSFRTSHYPYDEEIMRLADRLGFLVIDEVPAVSLGFLSDRFEELAPLLETHTRFLSDLVARDANHPSVIAWSIVNEANLWDEPHYQTDASRRYFREVYERTRALDPTRPVIAITFAKHGVDDVALEACDLIGINRYYGWYDDPADVDAATRRLAAEVDALYQRYGRPVLLTEFGADAVAGLHATTPQLFTEEFQSALVRAYCRVAEANPHCAGAHVWNFADFRTPQHHRRVVLNLKGLFTRDRQPKSAAFAARDLWRATSRVAGAHRPRAAADDAFLVADRRP